MTHFTTEFGHTIPFVPGYFERNKAYAYTTKAAHVRSQETAFVEGEPNSFSVGALIKDLVQLSGMIEFLEKYGLLVPRKRGLDLGGAEGTVARLLKAAGLVEESANLDLDDYAKVTSDKLFDSFLSLIAEPQSALPPELERYIADTKLGMDHHPDKPGLQGLFTRFTAPARLDRNFHMSVFDADGSYDLITAFLFVQFLDPDEILPKIRSLLAPGGLVAILTEHWWFPINSTGIVGDFPYTCQRLSYDDLCRYFARHHPDLQDNVWFKYYYFHEGKSRPTVTDWFDMARRHGLRPVAVERIQPTARPLRMQDSPQDIFKADYFDHGEVLRDIHRLNPGVVVEDLFTSHLRIALTAV